MIASLALLLFINSITPLTGDEHLTFSQEKICATATMNDESKKITIYKNCLDEALKKPADNGISSALNIILNSMLNGNYEVKP